MSRQSKLYILGVYSVMFMIAVGTTTQGTLLSQYIDYYGLVDAGQGIVSTLQSTGQFLALFLVGFLAGRVLKSRTILVAVTALCFLFFLLATGAKLPLFLVFYFLYGLSIGTLDSLFSSLMVDYFGERSSVFMNVLHGIYGVGGLVGPLLARFCERRGVHWKKVLLLIGFLFLAAGILYMIGAWGNRGAKESMEIREKGKTERDLKKFFSQKRSWLLLILSFLYGGHQIGITVWMVRYISEYLGAPRYGALALGVFWITVAIGRFTVPHLPISRYQTLFLGYFISGLAMAAGVLIGNGLVMLICTAVCGLAEGTALPMALDISCHWIRENTSLGSTLVLICHNGSAVLMAPVIALAINRISATAGMLLPALFSLVAAAVCVLLMRMHRAEKAGESAA